MEQQLFWRGQLQVGWCRFTSKIWGWVPLFHCSPPQVSGHQENEGVGDRLLGGWMIGLDLVVWGGDARELQ